MSNSVNLTNEEFFGIARDLEQYHAVFSKIWQMGKPKFTDTVPTAAVSFDTKGRFFNFEFNPDFWMKCTPYERNFVICHESLHVILNHGDRLRLLNRDAGNIAADVVINEMLVGGFGFDRKQLLWADKNACWLNTVFKDNPNIEANRSLEYYYNNLMKNSPNKTGLNLIDGHDGLNGMSSDSMQDIVDDLLNGLNEKEKEVLKNQLEKSNPDEVNETSQMAGTFAGNLSMIIKIGAVKKKRKWETVIKRWANTQIRNNDKDHEQWARVNRRFVGISTNLFLPSEMEIEEREEVKRKIKVIFFQDTSGSCYHLAKRFFTAAKSLPKDRFDVELYCFDTRVYKTSLSSGKLHGFGGTSFSVLESYVYNTIAKGNLTKYPKAIFVITDGYGDSISPQIPSRWYWFLSSSYDGYIPKGCNIFQLSNFE